METKNCPQCEREFEGRSNKVYCSSRCKMTAFYSHNPGEQNGYTLNRSTEKPEDETLTDIFSNTFTKSTGAKTKLNENGMISVYVAFTPQEKNLLERQAQDCETDLAKLIRISCLMDETDIRAMRQTIAEQKKQIEELRIKMCFYQNEPDKPVKRFSDPDEPEATGFSCRKIFELT